MKLGKASHTRFHWKYRTTNHSIEHRLTVKVQDLKAQVEILRQIHERHMDQKNSAISALATDVNEADEQYSTALQAHCINIDTLIELQTNRLETLQNQFQTDLETLETEFNTEK
jgi:D-ribose pyranose/furanose isomerase RbsD